MSAAPGWTQESYADALTNKALSDLERQLSLLIVVRGEYEWDTRKMVDLQRHALAVALSKITAADRKRGGPPPPAPPWLIQRLRKWRLAR